MPKRKRPRVALIGIDAWLPYFVEEFAKQGYLPNLRKMMRRGFYSRALPCFPTETGTNWATISTGAYPIRHQCNYWVHYNGMPLNQEVTGFSSRACKAEQIWTTAEKAGLRSVIFDYPQSYPLNIKNVIHVGEDGRPDPASIREIAFCTLYSTEKQPDEILRAPGIHPPTCIKLQPAQGWSGEIKSQRPPLESAMIVEQQRQNWPRVTNYSVLGPALVLHMLITDSTGSGYDTVTISAAKDIKKAHCVLTAKEPVGWVIEKFEVEGKNKEGVFRVRLIDLDPAGKRLKVYRNQVYQHKGFAYPKPVADELLDECGPYIHHPFSWHPVSYGWYDKYNDREAYLGESGYQTEWYGRAAKHVLAKHDWSLFMMKWHGPDHLQHAYWADIDPEHPLHDKSRFADYWDYFGRYYALGDKLVGDIMEACSDDAVVMVVSDHAFCASIKHVDYHKAYEQAGLLYRNPDRSIDWSRTKAFKGHVNLKGREPHGIVEPGQEYEEVRERMIEALRGIIDPDSGLHAVKFAWKVEEALCLGVGGEIAGDVVYAFNLLRLGKNRPPDASYREGVVTDHWLTGGGLWGISSGTHGAYLPTDSLGFGTMNAMFAMLGPGVRHVAKPKRLMNLVDVAPTIAHILGIPRPAQADGVPIFEGLEK